MPADAYAGADTLVERPDRPAGLASEAMIGSESHVAAEQVRSSDTDIWRRAVAV